MSTTCSQSIKHICTVNSLTGTAILFEQSWINLQCGHIWIVVKDYSSWEDRNGVINTYWSGNRNASDSGCQCFIDGNCRKTRSTDPLCNCDTIGADLVDSGSLTNKEVLPVKSLRYGGATTHLSSIKYILGPLVCSCLLYTSDAADE